MNDADSAGLQASSIDDRSNQPITSQSDREAQPVDAEQPPRLPFAVVGIGASAGGLESFGDFLKAMRPDSGMAFVFVLHLSPDRHSLVAELLSRHTQMPVREVIDGMAVEPNHVYVIRPAHVLTIAQGHLHLGPRLDGPRAANRPVDDFFKSLAQEQRERAIGVLLSGMGSNGTAGAQAIKAVGGMCIAEDPETAQYSSMPQHLIEAGYADFISRASEMPEVLLHYVRQPYASGGREGDSEQALQRDQQYVREILAVLRTRTRHDFNGYKKPTVLRRIQRRMGLARVSEMREYAKLLRQSPTEVTALADDLLIHVTGFFRDAEAWESLRTRIVAPMVAGRENDSSIRCWVTACSSGEEAYSLAILLHEEAERADKHLDIKVFATDMAERTLANARSGIYPGGIEAEISPDRLARYFEKEHEVYRVRQELRERVVFAPQNLLQDPPFSRLDIITCRNLLIYLEPKVQQRVLALMHFGLREGGALFLGSSETLGLIEDLFEPVDKKARIFRRVGPTRHGMVDFPLPNSLKSPSGTPGGESLVLPDRRTGARATHAQLIQRALLEHHLPSAVLVDRDNRILHFQGNTGEFLGQPSGEPTRDLLSLAREGLRGAIRLALHRAAEDSKPATATDGWLEVEPGRRVRVKVTASPIADRVGGEYFVVSFQVRDEQVIVEPPADIDPDDDDLRRMRDELQSTIEELQTSNEELKASHEEVVSINEELQSSNEELETSKEEMQSLNEELTTVNAQLRSKMEEHQAASNDLVSLLKSTDIAVLFLDTQFCIRRFTPAVRELFELIASDIGRPLSDLAHKFVDPDLQRDGELVLENLSPIEREVVTQAGRWFLRRVTPYRTADNHIDGIVLAFVDITARKLAEAALRDGEVRLKGQKEAFEAAISGATLEESLGMLIRTVTDQSIEGTRAAFYIVDPDQRRVRPVAAVGSMPEDFLKRFDGIEMGEESLALGLAVGTRTPVITRDALQESESVEWAQIAGEFDFRACWSFPIQTHSGEPVGAFAMYHRQPRDPTERDIALATAVTHAAAILISRKIESEKLARSEKALELSEKREAFLLKLSDSLRPLRDPAAIGAVATRLLGQQLDVDRVGFAAADDATQVMAVTGEWRRDGIPAMEGNHRIDHFGKFFTAPLREGRLSTIEDAAGDPRIEASEYQSIWAAIGVRASIAYPLIKQGRLVAALFIHQANPRHWNQEEIRLVEEIVERTWAAVEQARAEESLRDSEERYRHLVEGVRGFAMLMLDGKGQIAAWNVGAERLLGYNESQAIGKHGSLIFTAEDIAAGIPAEELSKAATEGHAENQRWHVRRDGTRFWATVVTTALRTSDGSIRGYARILRDETPRKNLEAAEAAALQAAQQANLAKDEFLSVLSHELRTPLSAILLWARLLADDSNIDRQQMRDGLAAIRSSADAQRELIDDLLDVSRITSGKLRLKTHRVDLAEILRTAADAIAPSADAKGVALTADAIPGSIFVIADPERMRQVVWNLLTNAVKFTPSQGEIKLELRPVGNEAEIRISDTGRGIDVDFLPHLFERFRQEEGPSTRTQGGLGLGLSIAKQLVELHGGTIWAESAGPNRGATFSVRLPLSERSNKRSKPAQISRNDPRAADLSRLKGISILLVEDDEMTRRALSAVLQSKGMRTSEASSAEAALESFRTASPDLVLSDIGLPEKDGYALLREIRQFESSTGAKQTPAIALTAFARDIDRNRADDAGFQEHLAKPIDADRLLQAIAGVLFGG